MSRLSAIARRDLPSWLILALGLFLVTMTTPGILSHADSPSAAMGASPLLGIFVWLDALLPNLRIPAGMVPVFRLSLLLLAAMGVFYSLWRLTRNRVVSLGAGFLISVHPQAMFALNHHAGMRDILGMTLLAWMLCVNARPRFRSSRFPNLPPAASNRMLIFLMVLAILAVPGGWLAPLILLAMDLFFHREPGRGPMDRNWRSYWPHLLYFSLGFLLELVWGADAQKLGLGTYVQGIWSSSGAIFFAGSTHGVLKGVLVLLVVLGALLVGILEILFDMGRRRLTLPYIGFAGLTAAIGLVMSPLLLDARLAAGSWLAFVGFAMALPVLAWRLVMKFLPPIDAQPIPAHVNLGPNWEDVLVHANLTPLPDLSNLPPAPNLEAWAATEPMDQALLPGSEEPKDALQSALDRLGISLDRPQTSPKTWDADFGRRELEPFLEPKAKVLAFLPSGSPYAAFAASLCGSMTILEKGDQGFTGLSGFDHLHTFEFDGKRPWPAMADSFDFVFSIGCLSRIRTPELQGTLAEFRRILTQDGHGLLVFEYLDGTDAQKGNPLPQDMAANFCREAGLLVNSIAEASEGSYRILVSRGEG